MHLVGHVANSSVSNVIVDRFHPLLSQRARVFAHLLADLPEARIDRWVVAVRGFAVQDAAWPVLLAKFGVLWIIRELRLFLGVQVVKITIEFVEAMHRRQEFVAVTKVIFAKLSRRVTERL